MHYDAIEVFQIILAYEVGNWVGKGIMKVLNKKFGPSKWLDPSN